jgi:ornithine--oxo-acid transaminase
MSRARCPVGRPDVTPFDTGGTYVTMLGSRDSALPATALVADHMERAERHAAHNYKPLPVVAQTAHGAWITDVTGRRYLDCLAAYSPSTSATATR